MKILILSLLFILSSAAAGAVVMDPNVVNVRMVQERDIAQIMALPEIVQFSKELRLKGKHLVADYSGIRIYNKQVLSRYTLKIVDNGGDETAWDSFLVANNGVVKFVYDIGEEQYFSLQEWQQPQK